MSEPGRKPNHEKPRDPPLPASEREKRKERVLTKRNPSIARIIADTVMVKDEDLYFLTERDGRVPLGNQHSFGLHYHDCRFLNGYEIKLAGTEMSALAAAAPPGGAAVLELTNHDFYAPDGRLIEKEAIGITRKRTFDGARRMLGDQILFRNFSPKEVDFDLTMTFEAAFEDVFAVRGLLPERSGRLHPPVRGHLVGMIGPFEGVEENHLRADPFRHLKGIFDRFVGEL